MGLSAFKLISRKLSANPISNIYRSAPYLRAIRSKTYHGYVKPRIKPNPIYNVIFL
jgi:hypothetical protein